MNYHPHPDFPDQGPYVPTVCHCHGEYLCDMHRPAPPPPLEGACVLCGRIEPADKLTEGRIRWHDACAADFQRIVR